MKETSKIKLQDIGLKNSTIIKILRMKKIIDKDSSLSCESCLFDCETCCMVAPLVDILRIMYRINWKKIDPSSFCDKQCGFLMKKIILEIKELLKRP